MLVFNWATVCDAGLTLNQPWVSTNVDPTLTQHWVNVSCLLGSLTVTWLLSTLVAWADLYLYFFGTCSLSLVVFIQLGVETWIELIIYSLEVESYVLLGFSAWYDLYLFIGPEMSGAVYIHPVGWGDLWGSVEPRYKFIWGWELSYMFGSNVQPQMSCIFIRLNVETWVELIYIFILSWGADLYVWVGLSAWAELYLYFGLAAWTEWCYIYDRAGILSWLSCVYIIELHISLNYHLHSIWN